MLSGVVLSGGQSKRLGREKGLALLGGTPLVGHVVRAIGGLADEVLISVAGGMAAIYEGAIEEDVRIVEDSRPRLGPLEGLVSTFGAARGEYVLVAPCDTPFLKAKVCEAVLKEALGKNGAVPVINGYYEPLHAAYHKEAGLRAFESSLKDGKRKVTDAYPIMSLAEVDEATIRRIDPALESFWNMNTAADLAEAEKRLNRVPRRLLSTL